MMTAADLRAKRILWLQWAAESLRKSRTDCALCGPEFHRTIARGCLAGARDTRIALRAAEASEARAADIEAMRAELVWFATPALIAMRGARNASTENVEAITREIAHRLDPQNDRRH